MLFKTFSNYLHQLESTDSRNEMTEILAEILEKSSAEEIDKLCYLLVGRVAPLYETVKFNLGEKMMVKIIAQAYKTEQEKVKDLFEQRGDLGEVAEKLSENRKAGFSKAGSSKAGSLKAGSLTVLDIHNKLLEIAVVEGKGSVERKSKQFANLLSQISSLSAKYVVRIPIEKMRLGLGEKTILDALSWMEKEDKSLRNPLEQAYNACPDIGYIAKTFRKKGKKGIEQVSVTVGRPVLPMLCQRIPTAEEIMEKMKHVYAEAKFDGTRVQVHLDKSQPAEGEEQTLFQNKESVGRGCLLKAFTRNLEDVTLMFPDILSAVVENTNAESLILDGEAVGYDPKSGNYLPFQVTMQRKRKYGIEEKSAEVPLRYFVFDLLYLNGESLLKQSYTARRRILKEVIDGKDADLQLTKNKKIESAEELIEELENAVEQGLEGLVLKNGNSEYEAGTRGFSWVKFKYEGEDSLLSDTVDCVVLGYYSGKGRRSELGIGAFLVGVYDSEADLFKTVSKIGTGLTDEQWREMKKRCDNAEAAEPPARYSVPKELKPSVWSSPDIIVEISADEITESPLHTAGYALRFPRLTSWRDDKKAEDATSLKELKTMFKDQGVRNNN